MYFSTRKTGGKREIINLTPHDINIIAEGTALVLETIPVSGVVARVGMEEEYLRRDGNILFVRVRPGRPVNVPEPCRVRYRRHAPTGTT